MANQHSTFGGWLLVGQIDSQDNSKIDLERLAWGYDPTKGQIFIISCYQSATIISQSYILVVF